MIILDYIVYTLSKVSTESPHRGQPNVGQQRQQADTRIPEQTVPETNILVTLVDIIHDKR